MEHHRDFSVYSKNTRTERIVDTLSFNHKYLTSPVVTPEDKVVEATKRLTDVVTANSNSNDSEQMVSFKTLTNFFKQFAEKYVK